MPPLKTFIFQSISDAQIEIVIKTYGSEIEAKKRLNFHVSDDKNWTLKSIN